MVAGHFRRRLLILSVSTLGFFISSFSAVLALDFTGPVVSVLDGDTIEVLHNRHPERIRLNGIDCPEKGQPKASERSKPLLNLSSERKSHSRPTASTSTDGQLPMCS